MKNVKKVHIISAIIIFVVLAAFAFWLLGSKSDYESPFLALDYVWNGIILFFILPMLALLMFKFLPAVLSANFAYKLNHRIYLYPAAEKGRGVVDLEIHNVGDGAIVVDSVGFIDSRWVQIEKNSHELKEVAIPCLSVKAPLRIAVGEVARFELKVDGVEFERRFSAVYYDIDCMASDAKNSYSELLSKGTSKIEDAPEGILRKIIRDRRLQKMFVGKVRRNKQVANILTIIAVVFASMILFWLLLDFFNIPTRFEFSF